MQPFDAIVVGVGGVGSAALYHLARRGLRTLGIERFELGHDRGSSHGQTRLIRQTYFEHPHYVPLVRRAFELWHALEQEAGETLYFPTGLVQIGRADGEVLAGVRRSAAEHQIAIENLSAAEAERRFAGLRIPADCEAVYEAGAGYLRVEPCVQAHARQAMRLGAEVRCGEIVRGWHGEGAGFAVETDRDAYHAERLILTAGPWAGSLLGELGIPLEVRRKPLYWFETHGDEYRTEHGFPAFLYELDDACFYGFPQIDARGLKVAEHSGGRVVADPLLVDRQIDAADQRRVADFVAAHLPQASATYLDHTVCMYTMSPDGHFLLDRHPRHAGVAFAAGLSGHGFKFACVLGEELARLACEGQVAEEAKFLGLDRESLRGVC